MCKTEWFKTTEKPPPNNDLVLVDDGCAVFSASYVNVYSSGKKPTGWMAKVFDDLEQCWEAACDSFTIKDTYWTTLPKGGHPDREEGKDV